VRARTVDTAGTTNSRSKSQLGAPRRGPSRIRTGPLYLCIMKLTFFVAFRAAVCVCSSVYVYLHVRLGVSLGDVCVCVYVSAPSCPSFVSTPSFPAPFLLYGATSTFFGYVLCSRAGTTVMLRCHLHAR